MSIEYHFVNKDKRNQINELKKMLDSERNALIERLHQFCATHPLAEGNVEDMVYAIRQTLTASSIQAYDEVIGVATSTKFHWNTGSDFRSVKDVEQFLKEHPNYGIENDYGELISLNDLIASIKDLL